MKIDIERFGLKDVSVDAASLLTFPQGFAGFEHCKQFKLFNEEGKSTVLYLQSMDDPSVMFPVITPETIDLAYEIELSDADCELIELKDMADIAVFVIVYKSDAAGGKIAANTRSPVIVNLKARKGMQKILTRIEPHVVVRGN